MTTPAEEAESRIRPLSKAVHVLFNCRQIHVRIAEDVIKTLGWEDGSTITVSVGTGDLLGKVRFAPPMEGWSSAARVRLEHPARSRNRLLRFAPTIIEARRTDFKKFDARFTAAGAVLTVDMTPAILEVSHAQ